MKKAIKRLLKSSISGVVSAVAGVTYGRMLLELIIGAVTTHTCSIKHNGVELTFAAPNTLNRFRIDTFSTKEPETLEWIDDIPKGSVLWDIGANVGLYSCYAAKAARCRVYAFEPSVFNLEMLARNVFLNALTGQVTIIPLPLSETLSESTFNMSSTDWGGALSTFGQAFGHDGRVLQKVFGYATLGLSMLDAVELLKIPRPDYIKMDVDGIEHLILKGGVKVLQKAQGVLIEINEQFEKQSVESARYLSEAGLQLIARRQAEMFDNTPYEHSFNQIWQRT